MNVHLPYAVGTIAASRNALTSSTFRQAMRSITVILGYSKKTGKIAAGLGM
jgi:hypothetical protein